MKVLMLAQHYIPVLNSAARLFAELADDILARGHTVTVLTTYPTRYLATGHSGTSSERLRRREEIRGVDVVRLKGLPWLPKKVPLFRAVEQLATAIQYYLAGLRIPRHDVVIVYSPPLPLGLAGIWLAHRWEGRLIVNIQDLYPQAAVDIGVLRNPLLLAIARRLERTVHLQSTDIVVHSGGNRSHVVAHGGSAGHVHVVPNWIDLERYSPNAERGERFRKKLGLDQAFIVSYGGVIGFFQGSEAILRAATQLASVAPDIQFVMAGGGTAFAELKSVVRKQQLDNVLLLSHLPEEEYVDLLRASDVSLVTLSPTLSTPVVPGKLPCIMGVGCPVVCSTSSRSDARSIVEESHAGIWTTADNPDALGDGIMELYQNRPLAKEMGQSGRAYVEKYYRRKLCTDVYLRLIEKTSDCPAPEGNAKKMGDQ